MKTTQLTQEQKKLLVEIESADIEIEYFLSTKESADDDDYFAHKEAALAVLQKIQKDTDKYYDRLLLEEKYREKKRSDFYQVAIDEEKLNGKKISLKTFLGRFYSVEKNRCALRGHSSNFLNSYFWAGEEEIIDNVLDIRDEFGNLGNSYTYAFFEPPYDIRGSRAEKENIFRKVEELFFEKFDSSAQIWKWNDNCSNFFDAGKEWWGTYFYTYSLPKSEIIVGIAASSTD